MGKVDLKKSNLKLGIYGGDARFDLCAVFNAEIADLYHLNVN